MADDPLARRYRAEARALHQAADRILYELELGIERVTAMKREAARLEAMADERDDLVQVQALAGSDVRVRKERRAA